MRVKDNKALPAEAFLDFQQLLIAHGVSDLSKEEIEILALNFLRFLKILLKGTLKNK